MRRKPTKLMLFHKNTILNYIPETNAVYFLRGIADENSLYPIYYIGKASRGEFREKLLDQYFQNDWSDIVYINFIECDTKGELQALLKQEIKRHKPKYNKTFAINEVIRTTQTPRFQFNY